MNYDGTSCSDRPRLYSLYVNRLKKRLDEKVGVHEKPIISDKNRSYPTHSPECVQISCKR